MMLHFSEESAAFGIGLRIRISDALAEAFLDFPIRDITLPINCSRLDKILFTIICIHHYRDNNGKVCRMNFDKLGEYLDIIEEQLNNKYCIFNIEIKLFKIPDIVFYQKMILKPYTLKEKRKRLIKLINASKKGI